MDIHEAMAARHSVRRYTDRRIGAETAERLREEIDACIREGNLRMQLILDEPEAFGSILRSELSAERRAACAGLLVGKA